MATNEMVILNMNPGWDHWLFVKTPPPFENIVRADSLIKMVSGKGTNVARVLNTLRFTHYRCISLIGGEVGSLIENDLAHEGILSQSFKVKDESRINFCVIREYDHNALQLFNEPGPILTSEEAAGYVGFVRKVLNQSPSSSLVISGSAARGLTARHLNELVGYAVADGHPVCADIGGEWLKNIVSFPISVLKVNREEFQLAFGIDMDSQIEVESFRQAHGIGTIIITDGGKGCIGWNSRGQIVKASVSDPPHSVGFTAGCGDSFLAGYLVACSRGLDFHGGLVYANACGIANTLSFGPASFTLSEVESCLPYVQVENQ